jgi:TRAP-type mannitol/chloroaromatic compound transport system permease small subunit
MALMERFYRGVGWLSEWSGRLVSYLMIPLVLNIVYDVFARYLFNAPTIWSFTLSYMLCTAIVSLGLAYVYYHNANVRVDLVYMHLPLKGKLVIDIGLTALVTFPLVLMLARVWALDAWHALLINELATETCWYPPLFPLKAIITIGFSLLFLQSVATLLRDLVWLRQGGEQPWLN